MPDFIVQKLLSTDPKLYCAQGQLAGSCAIHAAAGALAVLGMIADPSRISTPRSESEGRRLWLGLKDQYADGISLADLAQRICDLDFGLKLTHLDEVHHQTLAFAEAALLRGNPVILSLAPVNRPRQLHAVVAAGLQGAMEQRRFVPHALLCVDSADEHPGIGPFNCRIDYSPSSERETSALCVTSWERYRVMLTGAVSLQLSGSARQDPKPQ